MGEKQPQPTREERLAERLRENLRRRKAQTRQLDARAIGDGEDSLPKPPGGR